MISPLIQRSEDSSSSVNKEQCGEDIISKLPEALLLYILSLLPEPLDAIRTCILSKRWKYLWVFLPNLYFVLPYSFESAEQVKTFHDSVDNALALRGGMLVQKFFLTCFSQEYNNLRVLISLSIAPRSKLKILELNFPTNYNKLMLWWDFLKDCSTLVELTLKGVCVFDVSQAEFLFPCLKKVKLTSVDYLGDQSLQNLIFGCPVLQELCLEKQSFPSSSKKTKIISSLYLKRLRIQRCFFNSGEVLIDAPRLEYLYIEDDNDTKYFLRNPLSLVEAHIDKFCDTVAELLTCVSVATRLTLAYQSLSAIFGFRNQNMPMFSNLVKLDVHIHCRWEFWRLLFKFLNNMPLLEKFTISYQHLPGAIDHTSGILPGEAPTCLRFKIKEIILRNEGVVTQNQVILIGYLLRHSTVLERLTLNAHDIDQKMRQQLLNFHCGSHMCRIELLFEDSTRC